MATGKLDRKQLALAEVLIRQNMGESDPAAFTDRYSESMLELIKARIASDPLEIDEETATGRRSD